VAELDLKIDAMKEVLKGNPWTPAGVSKQQSP